MTTTRWSCVGGRKGQRYGKLIQPNRFVLHSSDGKTNVDYETTSFIGQPTLNLSQGPGPIRHFAGSQIRRVSTEIGTLVMVTTQLTVDTGSRALQAVCVEKSLSELVVSLRLKKANAPPRACHEYLWLDDTVAESLGDGFGFRV